MTPRSIDQRKLDSAKDYVAHIFEKHAKVQVIRLDLGHKKPETGANCLQELKHDVAHLLANRRGKPSLFKDMAGYMVKYENGEERGPHAHAILLFDGHQLNKDAHRADLIGNYWVDTITKGNGNFHNVNRNKATFDRCGIGMIDHTDMDKRQALVDDVLPYLAKTDQSIADVKASTKERAFTRGTLPKPKSKAGRPRLYVQEPDAPVAPDSDATDLTQAQ